MLRVQLIFPSKPKFCNFFEFIAKNPLKNNTFHILILKIVK
jgi:hypothetical protein